MRATFKHRVFTALEGTAQGDPTARVLSILITALIALNVLAFVLESVESIDARYHGLFVAFELASVAIFATEYLLRVWAAPSDARFASPVMGRVRFALTPLAIVDLAAILPTVLEFAAAAVGVDLRFLRALRFLRLFRLLKLDRYARSGELIGRVLRDRRTDLLVTLGLALVLLLVSSSVLYLVEHEAQPDKFSSIPDAMWWSAVTLTTIGYGDVYPVTPLGKLLGAMTAVLGVGIVALPTAIIATGFLKEVENRRSAKRHCPHCGKAVEALVEAPGQE